MSKARGQSRIRSIKRGNTNYRGVSLKRPFNNRKRTKGRKAQLQAEKYYMYIKQKIKEAKIKEIEEQKDKLIEKQIRKLDEGIRNN